MSIQENVQEVAKDAAKLTPKIDDESKVHHEQHPDSNRPSIKRYEGLSFLQVQP